jgi:tetratricopeptide (TPR) repeat protein
LQAPGAWLGAALWALHPVEVESVAWITETKNTESGLFFLLSILFFMKWLATRNLARPLARDWNYALTLLFAILAMACKSSTVILPVVLCLCAWWMEGRWQWRHLASVIPIFLVSIIDSLLSIWTQNLHLAIGNPSLSAPSLPARVATAGDAIWFYLGKLLWPHPLIVIYPGWKIDAGDWLSYLPTLAVPSVLFVLWLKRDSWSRAWFFVFAYFVAALLPALGLVDNYIFRYSPVFDHFQYLASMGPLALVGAGIARRSDAVIPKRPWLQILPGAAVLLPLAILSWHRAGAFHNDETLWTDTLAKNPNCWAAYGNLGAIFIEKGYKDEATAFFLKALEINPADEIAENNLGNVDFQAGRVDEAVAHYQKALEFNPNYDLAHANLGVALAREGRGDEAIAEYKQALKINPFGVDAHNDLGDAFLQMGQTDDAITQYQKALEIDPNSAMIHFNLGDAYLRNGQLNEAIAQFQDALKIEPGIPEAHNNLGLALSQQGRMDDAIREYQKALQINPSYTEAHTNLGIALSQKGRMDEALIQFQETLRLTPTDKNAQNNLARAQTLIRQRSGLK